MSFIKLSIVAITIIFLMGCNRIIGTYKQYGFHSSFELSLFPNKSFHLIHNGEAFSCYLDGVWMANGRYLILSYDKRFRADSKRQVHEKMIASDSIIVLVNANSASFSAITLKNNDTTVNTVLDINGKCIIKKFPIDSISVYLLRYNRFEYRVKNKESNYFQIDMGDEIAYCNPLVIAPDMRSIDTFVIKKDCLFREIDGQVSFDTTLGWGYFKKNYGLK